MRISTGGLVGLLMAAAVAVPAVAQNASVPGALELYPNFNTIGVRLAFSGDANADATRNSSRRSIRRAR